MYVQLDIRTIASASMIRSGQLVGTLNVITLGQPRQFEPEELALLQGLADQAAQAITNAQLYEESARRLRHTQALREIDKAITASLDLRTILEIMLEQTTQQLGIDACDILRLSPEGVLTFSVGRGFRTPNLGRTRLQLGEGYAGQAVLERRLVHIGDLSSVGGKFLRAHLIADEDFVTYYCVPLIAKGQAQGALEVFHRSPLVPDVEWLEFLETLAGQAAIAVENITLFNDLQRSNAELGVAYQSTLEGWSRALDLRDHATEGHTERVTEMTMKLAQLAGVSDTELIHIRRGALLHDIGKMGVPDSILLKPGPLDESEWVIMRKHPQYAYDLLSSIHFLRPALDIPYCHHEKWDGSGYPRGLKGEQIPFAARLFSVVDIWDALTSDRPYRAAWTKEDTLEYIKSLAGTYLDPRLVDLFLRVVK
jgi:HD-GYP domain-containing protein (c-di-GMP phosphodiesterase class II)